MTPWIIGATTNWPEAPPNMPKHWVKPMAVARNRAGNPREAGPYTIRAKFSPGTMSRPHWHPEARYVTVLKGTWWAGEGDVLDPDKTTPVKMGGFAIHTPGKVHYDGAKGEEVIVQISGIGPSGTNIVNPAPETK